MQPDKALHPHVDSGNFTASILHFAQVVRYLKKGDNANKTFSQNTLLMCKPFRIEAGQWAYCK